MSSVDSKQPYFASKDILIQCKLFYIMVGLVQLILGTVLMNTNDYGTKLAGLAMDPELLLNQRLEKAFFARVLDLGSAIVGTTTMLISGLACLVLWKNRLTLYEVLLHFVLLNSIFQLLIGIVSVSFIIDVKSAAALKNLQIILARFYVGLPYSLQPEHPISFALDYIMIKNKCCGINKIDDFLRTRLAVNWEENYKRYSLHGISISVERIALPVACCRFKETSFITGGKFTNYSSYMVNLTCPIRPMKYFKTAGCKKIIFNDSHMHGIFYITASVLAVMSQTFVLCFGALYVKFNRSANTSENNY